MKRYIKQSKKGFTLVETLLATFILVVVSTMLINGFISTMGYSYQTSVYSKSGAMNYEGCSDWVAGWYNLRPANLGADDNREVMFASFEGSSSDTTLEFKNPYPAKIENLRVAVVSQTSLTGTVPNSLSGYEFAPKTDAYVDNRTCFVYCPEYIRKGSDEATLGKIVVMADYSATPVKYYWVVDTGSEYLTGATKVSGTPIGT